MRARDRTLVRSGLRGLVSLRGTIGTRYSSGAVTVLDVIQRSTEFLARKSVDSPRLQIELMLAHVLGMPRLKLYLSFERTVSETELAILRELVRRRGNREPVQHIIGTVSFCGHELAVNRDVLIPRPETELLAEQCWSWLERKESESPRILDIGTGSGCIAVAVAARCPKAKVTAVDISSAALEVARSNATRHGLADRIVFLHGDVFVPLLQDARFDLIVSNPPYIPTAEIARLEPEVRDYEPRVALDGGGDGLVFGRRLAAEAPAHLESGGWLAVEFGDGQAGELEACFTSAGWTVESVVADHQDRPRILIARRD